MTATTRRTALGALLALPAASMPVVAASTVSPEERALLAIGPQLVKLLDEYDLLWSRCEAPYAAWEQARDSLLPSQRGEYDEMPEWAAYMEARRPADELDTEIVRLYEPFLAVPLTTLPAILLRHRYGMTFQACRDDALADLDRRWREGTLCA